MLKELLGLWHDRSPLTELSKSFDEMLSIAKEMFSMASSYLVDDVDSKSIRQKLVEMDGRLNTLQQVIRRDLLTHISVQGTTADIVPCLLLMSLVKDAERIGDYCKNIDEIFRHSPSLKDDPLHDDLMEMRGKILEWFGQTMRAFDDNDKDLAKSTREDAYLHEKECDRLLWKLAADNEGRNAVSIALMLRFFKRIAAHLGNICTSVSMPFDKLDYFEKPGNPGKIIEDD